jgi:hypothetical protein
VPKTSLSGAIVADAAAQRIGAVNGSGTATCGQYLQDRKTDARYNYQYTQWVSGYVSAYNFFSTHPQVAAQSAETVLAYLDKHCTDNPLHLVSPSGMVETPRLQAKQVFV